MSLQLTEDLGLLYMKVGVHAKESLEDIIRRKQKEYDDTGMIFWGYGGNTCHPSRLVQPFARNCVQKGKEVYLVMEEIDSRHFAEQDAAKDYSEDGFIWRPVPEGIRVFGSRYALVLDRLEMDDFDLNLRDLNVAVGPSRGRLGVDYIKGQVDKGCFELHLGHPPESEKEIKRISLYARLKEPFAVHVR